MYEIAEAAWGKRFPVEILACCDVDTRFTRSAAVFGPQKGASPSVVAQLTRRLQQQRTEYLEQHGVDVELVDGSGAAGGLAGALAVLGATLSPGFALVAAEARLAGHLRGAALVVTGEGRFDATSMRGKVTGGCSDSPPTRVPPS